MTRLTVLVAVIAAAACATGMPENDSFILDTGTGDGADTGWDVPPDVGWDTAPPDLVDTIPSDATETVDDTGTEDVGGDPGTCTVADFVTQTMCSPGYKCTIGSIDTAGNPDPICDVEGTGGWNETCTATGSHDDCSAGYLCVGSTTNATCKRYCSVDSACRTSPGGPNGACQIILVTGTTTIVGVTLCSIHCDPLSPYLSGCNTDQACRCSAAETGVWFSDCREYGTGTACIAGTADDCPRGEGCFDAGGPSSECLTYCSTSGSPGCSFPETCNMIEDWPTWIGACL